MLLLGDAGHGFPVLFVVDEAAVVHEADDLDAGEVPDGFGKVQGGLAGLEAAAFQAAVQVDADGDFSAQGDAQVGKAHGPFHAVDEGGNMGFFQEFP